MFWIFKRVKQLEHEVNRLRHKEWCEKEDELAKERRETKQKLAELWYDTTCCMDDCVIFYMNRWQPNEKIIKLRYTEVYAMIALNDFIKK